MTAAETRAAIIAHMRKTGRVPDHRTVGGYEVSHPVFEAMRADGTLIWVKRPTATGRRMTRLILPEQRLPTDQDD